MWVKRYKHWIAVVAIIMLGLIFLAAGAGKLLSQMLLLQAENLKLFIFPDFFPPALARAVYIWIPRIEIVVGVLLIFGIAARFMASISAVLVAGFITNNILLLTGGLGSVPCNCFGLAGRLAQEQLSVVGALYMDAAMLVLVLVVIFCYQRNFFSIRPWFLARGKSGKKKDWSGSG